MFSKLRVLRVILLLSISGFVFANTSSHTVCSLDRMRKFAMDACDHLMMRDEVRNKREIPYSRYDHNSFGNFKKHETKYHITRSSYPLGGYLKVSVDHYKKLCYANVEPKYRSKKVHHEKKLRWKRGNGAGHHNIWYCCFNECNSEFFC